MDSHTYLWDSTLQAAGSLEVQRAESPEGLEFFAMTFHGVPVCPERTAGMTLVNGSEADWRKAAAISRKKWGDKVPLPPAPKETKA